MKNLRNIALLGGLLLLSGCTKTGDDDVRDFLRTKLARVPGKTIWAKSLTAGAADSVFNSVAVDSAGNSYAAGYQTGTGSYTYAPGVSVTGISAGSNAVLVKYDAAGVAQWAKSVTTGGISFFNSVAFDSSGNIYAAGRQHGTGSFTYAPGVSAVGSSSAINIILVKYNSSGVAQWAKSITAGTSDAEFNSVVVDASGNVYAAGYQSGTGTYTYAPGVSVTGVSGVYNSVLVKYNIAGLAQWAKSVTAGTSYSRFYSASVDSSGNVYAAGFQNGTSSYTYAPGVSVTGASASDNITLVKYDSAGVAQWAKSVTAGTGLSTFYSTGVDSSGNIYAVGYQTGTGAYTYAPGVSVTGIFNLSNSVLVKYNSSGVAQWAKSVSAGTDESKYKSVAVDASGNSYVAGYQFGPGTFTYAPGVSVAGNPNSYNFIIVQFDAAGVAQWARTVSPTAFSLLHSEALSVAVDLSGNSYAAGYQTGTTTYTYGTGVSAAGTSNTKNVVLVKYQ